MPKLIEKNNEKWLISYSFGHWKIVYIKDELPQDTYFLSDDPDYRDEQLKHSVMFMNRYKEISEYIAEESLRIACLQAT